MKIYTLPLILLLSFSLQSQDFATPDSEWTFQYGGITANGCVKLTYEKDTIINGLETRQFYKHYDVYSQGLSILQYYKTSPEYFRYNSDQVFVWLETLNTYEMLFDFNAVPGQNWSIEMPSVFNDFTQIECTVTDNGIETLNGLDLRWYQAEFKLDDEFKYVDRIYEKIGPQKTELLPWNYFYGMLDGNQLGPLAKYEENGFEYINDDTEYCAMLLDTDGPIISETTFYPNPVDQVISFKNLEAESEVKVFNVAGQEQTIDTQNERINVGHLESGMYLLHVSNGISSSTLKFIKL